MKGRLMNDPDNTLSYKCRKPIGAGKLPLQRQHERLDLGNRVAQPRLFLFGQHQRMTSASSDSARWSA